MSKRIRALVSTIAAGLLVAACGGDTTDSTADAPAAAEPETTTAAAPPALPRTPAPEGARAYIVAPADGATVSSPVAVTFGAENIAVIAAANDTPDFGLPIPKSDQYVHFGGGQTETTLELEPGEYELRLLFGDHLHIPHDPPVYSEVVTITVE